MSLSDGGIRRSTGTAAAGEHILGDGLCCMDQRASRSKSQAGRGVVPSTPSPCSVQALAKRALKLEDAKELFRHKQRPTEWRKRAQAQLRLEPTTLRLTPAGPPRSRQKLEAGAFALILVRVNSLPGSCSFAGFGAGLRFGALWRRRHYP